MSIRATGLPEHLGQRVFSIKAVHSNFPVFPQYRSPTDTLDDNSSILKLLLLLYCFSTCPPPAFFFHYELKAKSLKVDLSDFSSFSPLITAENGSDSQCVCVWGGWIVFISSAYFHQMRTIIVKKRSLIVQNEHGVNTNL